MVHPCRSGEDTGGNPTYKMHACSSENSKTTLCGLPNVKDVNVVAGYRFLCPTCFPSRREMAWTPEVPNTGDPIGGEGREHQPPEPGGGSSQKAGDGRSDST